MTLAAVAVCPHPPLLVPEIAGAAAAETEPLRAACAEAIRGLFAARPERIVVLGGAAGGNVDRGGGLRGYAPSLHGLPSDLPLSLAIGRWLLDQADAARPDAALPRELIAVRPDGRPVGCGPSVPDQLARVGLLVMADGSARHGLKSPGYLDERAAPFDAAMVKALATADLDALAGLDDALCAELLVGGVGALKALAALAGGVSWECVVLYDDAPYGVQYTVASWLPA
jgi:hypothetical protein